MAVFIDLFIVILNLYGCFYYLFIFSFPLFTAFKNYISQAPCASDVCVITLLKTSHANQRESACVLLQLSTEPGGESRSDLLLYLQIHVLHACSDVIMCFGVRVCECV